MYLEIYILSVLVFLRGGLKGIPECGAAGVMVVLPRGRLSHYSETASATTLSLHIHIQWRGVTSCVFQHSPCGKVHQGRTYSIF